MAVSLKVNGAMRTAPAEPDTQLLYVLRNDLELNGAKFGCGLAQCGACTVLVDGAHAVIEAVARMANWKPGQKGGAGKGRGIGFAKYKNLATYVAVIAEVDVDRASGKVSVPRAWAAADSGLIINPDGLANQIEGGIIQSTNWTLHEEVKFTPAGIASRDWLSYPILIMPDVPKVEVELINRPEERPLGSGEGSQGPAVAAIANAFAAATGKRMRELPLTAERVKGVLLG